MAVQEKTRMAARPVPEENKASEYLANERTFLAWIRTSIAMISLGFVVARFGLWLSRAAGMAHRGTKDLGASASRPAGIAIAGFGGLMALLAAWRYHVVNKEIERGVVKVDRGLVFLVAA